MKKVSIVTEFKNLLVEYTDAPEELKEIVALTALSTVIGRKAVIVYEPKAKIFSALSNGGITSSGMYLNIYSFIIGESRVTRKSTTLDFLKDLILNIDENLLISQSFTPEALIEELKEKQGSDYAQVLWLVSEAVRFLESCRKREYMGEAQSLIQELYDGNTFTRRTKGGGLVTIKHPYFVTMFTTTPYVLQERMINAADFHHGFLNRFLLLRVKPSKDWREIKFIGQVDSKKAKPIFDYFSELYNLDKVMIISPTSDVASKFNEFDRKIKDYILTSKDAVEQSYIGNFPEFLLKLMGLYRLSRLNKKDFTQPILTLETVDYVNAIRMLDIIKESFKEIKTDMDRATKTVPFKPIDTSDWEGLVLNVMSGIGGKVHRSILLQKVQKYGINSKELDKILDELQQKNKILCKIERQPEGAGRSFRVYELTKEY